MTDAYIPSGGMVSALMIYRHIICELYYGWDDVQQIRLRY